VPMAASSARLRSISVKQFKVDYAVIGASAIDEDGALLDFDYREVRVSRAIIENARQVILVADKLKLERAAPVRIGHMAEIDTFVTRCPALGAARRALSAGERAGDRGRRRERRHRRYRFVLSSPLTLFALRARF